jgi:hypothetical protein
MINQNRENKGVRGAIKFETTIEVSGDIHYKETNLGHNNLTSLFIFG